MTGLLAIVCGLKSEAAVVRAAIATSALDPACFRIGVSGADASRAEDLAEGFVEGGSRGLLSVGISGGLDPDLAPGDLILSGHVISHASPSGLAAMNAAFDAVGADDGRRPIYGSDLIIQSAAEKDALFRTTGAVAVDMESHAVAHVAMAHGLPFLAIRAIADPASRALPTAALGAVAPDGSTRILKTLVEMAKAPGDVPALLQLGSDSEKALRTLRRDLGGLLGALLLRLDA